MSSLDKNIRSKKYLDSVFPDFSLSKKERYGLNELNELKAAVKAISGKDFPIASYQFIADVEANRGGDTPTPSCEAIASITYTGIDPEQTITEFTWNEEGIDWATWLTNSGLSLEAGYTELDLVWASDFSIDGLGSIIGTLNGTWYLYSFYAGDMTYTVYNEANTTDDCGLGNWTVTSSWNLSAFSTAAA